MQQNKQDSIELLNKLNDNLTQGTNRWVISRMQFKNAALFNRADFVLNGESSLIFGKNGAGKSSALDIYKCQLYGKRVRFNAAGNNKTSQRTLKDYLRGKWNDTQSLRDETKESFYSFIMTTYTNGQSNLSHLTIWKVTENDIKEMNAFSDQALDLDVIKNIDLEGRGRAEMFKKAGFYLFTERRDGIVNQLAKVGLTEAKIKSIVNMPSLGSVEGVTNLIESTLSENVESVQTSIKEFLDSAKAANDARIRLKTIEEQIEILNKIKEENQKLEGIGKEIEKIERSLDLIQPIGAKERIKELNAERDELIAQQAKCLAQIEAYNELIESKSEEVNNIIQDIARAEAQSGSEVVERSIKEQTHFLNIAKSRKAEILSNIQKLNHYLKAFGFEAFDGKRDYFEQIQALDTKGENEKIEALEPEIQQNRIQLTTIKQEVEGLTTQINALKNQKHNIPAEYVGVQTLIKQHFPELAGENKLPFLGELIKVKEEFKTTHGLIIEAVLRELNLPCALLLPKSLEQAVLTFLTEQATKKKLPNVRLLVVEDSIEVNDIDSAHLWHCLDFKQSEYQAWLSNYLKAQPELVLQNDLLNLLDGQGVVKQGVFKQSEVAIILGKMLSKETFNYSYLGWTNKEAIAVLESKRQEVSERKTPIERRIRELDEEVLSLKAQIRAVEQTLHFVDGKVFEDFCPEEVEDKINFLEDKIEELKEQLKQYDQQDYINALKKQKKTLEDDLRQLNQKKSQFNTQVGSFSAKIERINLDLVSVESFLQEHKHLFNDSFEQLALIDRLREEIEKSSKEGNIFEKAKKLYNAKDKRLATLRKDVEKLESVIEDWQGKYVKEYSAIHLAVGRSYIAAFLETLQKIEREELTAAKNRVNEANEGIVKNKLLDLASELLKKEQELVKAIAQKDEIMKLYPFSAETYMTLKAIKKNVPTTFDDKNGYKYTHLLEDIERIVKSDDKSLKEAEYQKILKRIQEKIERPDWQNENLDVRKWFRFEVKENKIIDGKEVAIRNWSGKSSASGGQGEKAIYYLMAIFHFATQKEDEYSADQPCFSALFVDEAFSKCDLQVAEYTSTLYKDLGLQFIPIMPKNDMLSSENFRSNYENFFNLTRNERKPYDGCIVRTISREELSEKLKQLGE